MSAGWYKVVPVSPVFHEGIEKEREMRKLSVVRKWLWIVTVLLIVAVSNHCRAGAKVAVGHNWPAGERVSIDRINHARWDALLRKYVDSQGRVNYSAWHQSREDRLALDQYLRHLSQADLHQRASREALLAYWINAYNGLTIQGILREYPTSSIRNHTAKVFGYNIWDDLLLTVGDRPFSLNQIEHDVLRKMGEPRVHFAIVCASIGCPPLLNQAYVADQLDHQLTVNTRRFFADPQKFRYDASRRQLELSPILQWFAEDFGANQAAQMRTIARFLPDQAAQGLAANGTASVRYLGYDWNLNDQSTLVR
jgi:hypothetical protein